MSERQGATVWSVMFALILGVTLRAAGNYWWEWKYQKLITPPDELICVGVVIALLTVALIVALIFALNEDAPQPGAGAGGLSNAK